MQPQILLLAQADTHTVAFLDRMQEYKYHAAANGELNRKNQQKLLEVVVFFIFLTYHLQYSNSIFFYLKFAYFLCSRLVRAEWISTGLPRYCRHIVAAKWGLGMKMYKIDSWRFSWRSRNQIVVPFCTTQFGISIDIYFPKNMHI